MSKEAAIEIRRPKARSIEEFVGTDGPAPVAPAAPAAKTARATKPVKAAPPPKVTKAGKGAAPVVTGDAPKIRGLAERSKGPAKGRLTVYLELDVAQKLRRHCFDNALDLSDECAKAIAQYVQRLPG